MRVETWSTGFPAGYTVQEPIGSQVGCNLGGAGEPAGSTGDDDGASRLPRRLPNGANSDYMMNNSQTNTLVNWTTPCTTPTPGAPNSQ